MPRRPAPPLSWSSGSGEPRRCLRRRARRHSRRSRRPRPPRSRLDRPPTVRRRRTRTQLHLTSAQRSQGYATELVAAVLNSAAQLLAECDVIVYTQLANERSVRLARRLGFREVTRFDQFGRTQWLGLPNLVSNRRRRTCAPGAPGVDAVTLTRPQPKPPRCARMQARPARPQLDRVGRSVRDERGRRLESCHRHKPRATGLRKVDLYASRSRGASVKASSHPFEDEVHTNPQLPSRQPPAGRPLASPARACGRSSCRRWCRSRWGRTGSPPKRKSV